MIIKEVLIENYLCYYGLKKFHLAEGLNIILGENGEGKTKFFEALEWLFKGDNSNLTQYISAKALAEVEKGESFKVRVAVTVLQYQEKKTLSKYFRATKIGANECEVSNCTLEGIEENERGERSVIDGNTLLDQIFPYQIRRYSMFKGEEELNIFDQDEALINLINLFSEAKYYDKYEAKGKYLKEAAEKAVDSATKTNLKNKDQYDLIEKDIKLFTQRRNDKETFVNITTGNIEKTEENIQSVEKHINNAEALEIVNARIRKLEIELSNARMNISENYTTMLFDEKWLLIGYDNIQKEFTEKVAKLNVKKRKLQTYHDKQIGVIEGEKKAKMALLKDVLPLPIGTPSKAVMQEMLNDEFCKVCNRSAEKGSEAYNFMYERLNEYLENQVINLVEEGQPEKLYKNNYLSRLIHLSTNQEDNISEVKNIKTEIKNLFDFNEARRQEVKSLEEKLEKELTEREKIIGNSSEGSDRLSVVLKNYNQWQGDLKSLNKDLLEKEKDLNYLDLKLEELQIEKEKIDLNSANSFLIQTRHILRDIEKIFKDTKNSKFEEFIELLSSKSNDIFSRINVDAFTGIIHFKMIKISDRIKVKIELQEDDGRIFHKPNQSLKTSMHISILLAISELTKEVREEGYPLIFDAPTSSFGENKMTEFLNLIYETSNQKIILIKDYIEMDENRNLSIKSDFENVKKNKGFWVKLQRPFEKTNLKTINTEVIEL